MSVNSLVGYAFWRRRVFRLFLKTLIGAFVSWIIYAVSLAPELGDGRIYIAVFWLFLIGVSTVKNNYIRFHWESSDSDSYWEMKMFHSEIAGNYHLLVTDFADDDDVGGLNSDSKVVPTLPHHHHQRSQ